jgi:hypothetical protein
MADTSKPDISKLLDDQTKLIASLQSKVTSQGTRITDLEAQLAAQTGSSSDDIASKIEANNEALAAAAA